MITFDVLGASRAARRARKGFQAAVRATAEAKSERARRRHMARAVRGMRLQREADEWLAELAAIDLDD